MSQNTIRYHSALEILKCLLRLELSQNSKESSSKEHQVKAYRAINELMSDPSKQEEVISRIETLIQRTDFQQELKDHKDYIHCWLMYSLKMRDQDLAIKYMIDHQIGIFEAKVHLNFAFFVEKYHRDFAKSEEIYTQALALEQTSEEFKKVILRKYNEFSGRMKERINRDIIAKIGEETFNQTIKSKKRKLSDAFPVLDVSVGSDSSSSKKRRMNVELKQYHETFENYQEGILYMKSTIKDFQELGVHESCLTELQSRPLSWLSKIDLLHQPTVLIESIPIQQNQSKQQDETTLPQSLKKLEQLSLDNEELKNDGLLRPSQQQVDSQRKSMMQIQQANLRSNTLHTIGETSLDGHSNISNMYNNSSTQLVKSKIEESKMSMEESQIFRTANNSCDDIQTQGAVNGLISKQDQGQDKLNDLLQQITSLIGPNQANQAQILLSQLMSLQNQPAKQIIEEQKQSIDISTSKPKPTVQTQFIPQQTTQSQNPSVQKQQTHQRFSYKNPSQDQENTDVNQDQRKLSGIFMKIFDEGENRRQSNTMIPQQQSSAVPLQENQSLSINSLFRSLQNQGPQPFNPKRESEMQSFNASFFDATPQDSKFTKNINANYSQEFFLKKKTISKGKFEMKGLEQPMIDDQDQFMSPFGLVSPMDNRTSARKSNVMKDCCGLEAFVPNHVIAQPNFVSMMYQSMTGVSYQQPAYKEPTYQPPTFQNTNNIEPHKPSLLSGAMSVFSNYTGRDQGKPSTGIVPTQSAPQVAKRGSTDSDGDVFQDCANDLSALPSQGKRYTETSKLPSALKIQNQGSYLMSEEQSRNGSKSVRFVNNQ